MDFLGIGPLELLLIALIAFIILGPKEIQKTGKTIGRELNKFIRSDTWKTLRQASDKMKSLPNDLIREAGIEEMKKNLDDKKIAPPGKEIPTTKPQENPSPVTSPSGINQDSRGVTTRKKNNGKDSHK